MFYLALFLLYISKQTNGVTFLQDSHGILKANHLFCIVIYVLLTIFLDTWDSWEIEIPNMQTVMIP